MIIPGQAVLNISTDSIVLFLSADGDDDMAYIFDPLSKVGGWNLADTSDLYLLFTSKNKLFVGSYADKTQVFDEDAFEDQTAEIETYIISLEEDLKDDKLIIKI